MKGHDQKYQRKPIAKNNFFALSNDTGHNQGNRNYSYRGRIKLNLLGITWNQTLRITPKTTRIKNTFKVL